MEIVDDDDEDEGKIEPVVSMTNLLFVYLPNTQLFCKRRRRRRRRIGR
jgi:hypothetical protein